MVHENTVGHLVFTGITVSDLLFQIERLIDAKFSVHPQKQKESGYLSRKEVSKLLRITLPTLHDWTKLGYLKSYKIGSRVLYKEEEVRLMIEQLPNFKHKRGVNHG